MAQAIEGGGGSFRCAICGSTFPAAEKHKLSVEDRVFYLCKNCSDTLVKYGLSEERHASEDSFKCAMCRQEHPLSERKELLLSDKVFHLCMSCADLVVNRMLARSSEEE